MKFEASTTIQATPDAVWAVLTDGSKYPEWDPNMERLEGTIGLGNKITAHTKLSDRAFPVKVSTFDVGKKMVWTGGMPLGLFKGERTFSLNDQGDGSTHVHVQEQFSGLLLGMMKKTIPDLQPSFNQFVEGLKARVEG